MMLPTIVTVAETAIRAVPQTYREGSLALGYPKLGQFLKSLYQQLNQEL